jgi:pyridoxine 5-phosphate synthase
MPDPARAALLAIEAGADGITAHLREDRRHITDDDMAHLTAAISKPLSFEMAATLEMVAVALRPRPHACCLVPEKREERTTEGGLDVVKWHGSLKPVIDELKANGGRVSLFIELDVRAIDAAASLGAPVVELHTVTYCHAAADGHADQARHELRRIASAAKHAAAAGIESIPLPSH